MYVSGSRVDLPYLHVYLSLQTEVVVVFCDLCLVLDSIFLKISVN